MNNDNDDFYERPTRQAGGSRQRRGDGQHGGGHDDVTRPAKGQGRAGESSPGAEDPRTRIHRPGARGARTDAGAAPGTTPGDEPADPPAGWLVIVDGPGKGHAVTVGIGANSIGRNPDQRIALSFGDEHISGEGHALLVYDPESRRFYINHGGGKNLTYVEGQLVMTPTELDPHAEIRIGETRMRFVPLCGEQFDWSDT
jgi:hypothetical protein